MKDPAPGKYPGSGSETLIAKCIAATKWPTDCTKEARVLLDIALAQTQLEVNDVSCRFSANSAPQEMTRLFKKALLME